MVLYLLEDIDRLRYALENLAGDVYLFSMGEVQPSTLMKTQGEALDALKASRERGIDDWDD